MNKLNKLIFFLIFFLLLNCSFDNKTGIWSGDEDEKKRIAELEDKQNETIKTDKLYSSEDEFSEEKKLLKRINLSNPKKNLSWEMSGLNYQNFIGNIYLSGADSIFLKKKIGKNKFSRSKMTTSPIIYKNNIFLSDDNGTIFNITLDGKIKWKKNIYKKVYKKIYKNLSFSIYKNIIYISDNIGFLYAVDAGNGKLVWIKNHGIPLKSKIKVFDDKVFLINQDNRLISFSTKDGSVVWDVRAISSFIKSQNLLSLAISERGDIISINSSGDLMKVNSSNGNIDWSLSTLKSTFTHATDFFKSSDIVIIDENVIFSNQSSIFSLNISNGYINWEQNVSSVGTPIINKENIFFVTENGYFVIININSGEIISSTNILKILKKKKQITKITGFIMGSGKIYSVTLNGFLIVSSASDGQVKSFKKIGNLITTSPIINDGKLFIYTEDSKILGFH